MQQWTPGWTRADYEESRRRLADKIREVEEGMERAASAGDYRRYGALAARRHALRATFAIGWHGN